MRGHLARGAYDIIPDMRRHQSSHQEAGHSRSDEREQVIQILALEYQALRSEILTLTSGRFQFFGLMTAAAALLASTVGRSITADEMWLLGSLAISVFIVGLGSFLLAGRLISAASERVASIEERINEVSYSSAKLLSWESEHQQRGLLQRITVGRPSRGT